MARTLKFKDGSTVVIRSFTMSECMEGTLGVCLRCGEDALGVEPDARGYECECCGRRAVYGLEEAAMMGFIDIDGDGE